MPVSVHFRGKPPEVRALYDTVVAALKQIGRADVDSTKTRIAFHVQTIFLELTPLASGLHGCLTLPQPATHPTIFRLISLSPRIHYHYFKLTEPKQIDASFRRLLAEGFKVGRREHLKARVDANARGLLPRAKSRGEWSNVPLRHVFVDTSRPLWRCPKCGNYFVSRNLAHSCVRVPLAKHFAGCDPSVRQTFDALLAALRRAGPIRVVSSKTRITFMVRMRFGSVTPQKRALPGGFFLTRPARHPLLKPGLTYGGLHGYRFRLTHPQQIDASLRALLAEAYQVGAQKHLERK
ncbi:MAG TPA: DUF5655 domain-containing protein [Candidatus Xenobia bacterium]|nr:DUF5655 domain-containing protein [Candidatus Xenobia bacterium]